LHCLAGERCRCSCNTTRVHWCLDKTSEEVSAEHDTSVAFALLWAIKFKFVINLETNVPTVGHTRLLRLLYVHWQILFDLARTSQRTPTLWRCTYISHSRRFLTAFALFVCNVNFTLERRQSFSRTCVFLAVYTAEFIWNEHVR
jgi:hypothetical protein